MYGSQQVENLRLVDRPRIDHLAAFGAGVSEVPIGHRILAWRLWVMSG